MGWNVCVIPESKDAILAPHADLANYKSASVNGVLVVALIHLNPTYTYGRSSRPRPDLLNTSHVPHAFTAEIINILLTCDPTWLGIQRLAGNVVNETLVTVDHTNKRIMFIKSASDDPVGHSTALRGGEITALASWPPTASPGMVPRCKTANTKDLDFMSAGSPATLLK